ASTTRPSRTSASTSSCGPRRPTATCGAAGRTPSWGKRTWRRRTRKKPGGSTRSRSEPQLPQQPAEVLAPAHRVEVVILVELVGLGPVLEEAVYLNLPEQADRPRTVPFRQAGPLRRGQARIL